MEKIIKRANFLHTDNDAAWKRFTSTLDMWVADNADRVTKREMKACLKAARSKFCRADFPSEGSTGFLMGDHLLQAIQLLIGSVSCMLLEILRKQFSLKI